MSKEKEHSSLTRFFISDTQFEDFLETCNLCLDLALPYSVSYEREYIRLRISFNHPIYEYSDEVMKKLGYYKKG
jgi:hypothetical protein